MKRGVLLALLAVAGCSGANLLGSPDIDERVTFEGNDDASTYDLFTLAKPDLERYWTTRRKTCLEDARFRILHHYGLIGHADATVGVEADGERVTFRIDEGLQLVLGQVHFLGNTTLPKEELEAALPGRFLGKRPRYSPRLLALLEDNIVATYRNRGFADVEARVEQYREESHPERMNLRVHILEGARYTIREVISTLEVEEQAEVTGEFFTPATVGRLEAAAEKQERDLGHPFARAQITPWKVIGPEGGEVILLMTVERGPKARIGEVVIRGNDRTRNGFIERRADLEPGAQYKLADIRRAAERLRQTNLFRLVQVGPGEYQDLTQEVEVDIQVEELDAGELAVRGGYGSLDGARGGAEASYRNILGGAESIRVAATASRFGWRADALGSLPYFFGTEFRPEAGGYYEERTYDSFEVASFGGSLSLNYPILPGRKLPMTGGVRHAVIETKKVEPGVPAGDLLDFDYTALFLSSSWDRRDQPLLPTSGFFLSGTVEWSDQDFNSQIQFVRTDGRAAGYLPLLPEGDLVLAASVQSGVIEPIQETNTIPISLRYLAGGTNTVRGYAYGTLGPKVNGDPTGGEIYLAMQSEMRFGIVGDLHGALFADAGNVWFKRNEFHPEHGLRWATGMGLRYHTPAGPIVADVAWNPRHYRHEDEDAVVFHLSIGFPF